MRNEPWVWPEVRDAGTSGAGAVPRRSAQLMGQQKKKKKKKTFIIPLLTRLLKAFYQTDKNSNNA